MEDMAIKMEFSEFYLGKKILITGHTGFKGSWLLLWLKSLGAIVKGYSLAPDSDRSLYNLIDGDELCESVIADVRNYERFEREILSFEPDIIFHMAAQPLVRYSYQNPVETYSTNVMGTVNVLETVRHTPSVRVVVNVTTDKCYENQERSESYKETEAMGGYDPYSSSKGCSELVTAAYRRSFLGPQGIQVATARAGNVIGGGDWAKDRLIPDILNAFESGTIAHIRNPHATRPWQHVLEPLRGYLMLAQRMYEHGAGYAQAWNFGPTEEDCKPVGWIVEEMARMWGKEAKWKIDPGDHPHEANFLKLNISKAHNQLDWKPTMRLADALERIIEWSKKRAEGVDIRELTLSHIHNYQSRLLIPS